MARGLGSNVRGGVKTILFIGAIIFFIIAMANSANELDWMALGLIFLTAGFLSDILDLDFRRPTGGD